MSNDPSPCPNCHPPGDCNRGPGCACCRARHFAAGMPELIAAGPETTVGYEYRNYEKLPFADADHAKHPDRPHRCRCACDEFVSPWCHEHGEQVARERREVRTTRSFGDWERYEWPGRGAAEKQQKGAKQQAPPA